MPRSSPSTRRQGAALLGLLIVLAASKQALAQPTSESKAAADTLFSEARALLDAGKLPEACAKFEESQRLDPAPGTALNLGDCFERAGRTASAYGAFNDAVTIAQQAGDTARVAEAKRRAQALEAKLSKLIIDLPPTGRPEGLTILRDSKPMPPTLWGSAIPVDPGPHTVEARAPERLPFSKSVEVGPGPAVVEIKIPALAEEPPPPPPRRYYIQRAVGIGLGSAGIAGLIAGGVLAGVAASKNHDSFAFCLKEDPNKCYAQGVVLRDQSIALANGATVAASIGAGLLIAGAVVFFTAPKGERKEKERPAQAWFAPVISTSSVGVKYGFAW